MSAVTSVSVNPNDAEGYVNKINIIDATGRNGEKLDAPCYYVPFGLNFATFGINNFVSSNLMPGINYPDRYSVGKKYIDVILTGNDDFEKRKPEIYSLSASKIEPKIFAAFVLYIETGTYPYAWRVKPEEMSKFPAPGTVLRSTAGGRYTFVGFIYKENNIKAVEYIGKNFSKKFEYLVFNADESVSIPAIAQDAVIVAGSLIDFNGNTLLSEVDMVARKINSYSLNNGLQTPTKGFGYIKLDYSYEAYRFLINYDCPDFYVEMAKQEDGRNWFYSNNKDNLAPDFFRVSVQDGLATVNDIYQLDKKAEFVEVATPGGSDFSSVLEEQSRLEEERTYEDENGVSSIKMRVVKNVTLKGADGKEWQLKFNEPPE